MNFTNKLCNKVSLHLPLNSLGKGRLSGVIQTIELIKTVLITEVDPGQTITAAITGLVLLLLLLLRICRARTLV